MNEGEMGQVLAESLRQYGSAIVQSFGLPAPFKPLLTGNAAVVSIRLSTNHRLVVNEFDVDGFEAEIKNLKRKVKEAETEIQSLNILLEKEKEKQPKEEDDGKELLIEKVEEPEKDRVSVTITPKKKRNRGKRKKKASKEVSEE